MKYFFDTEFITGFKKPIPFLPTIGNWNKKDFYIHLVSIGIVAEDGREYYAISNEFNPKLADDWVHKNVLEHIYNSFELPIYNRSKHIPGLWYTYTHYTPKRLMNFLRTRGKSNKQIANEIVKWISSHKTIGERSFSWPVDDSGNRILCGEPEFYAYYADYDWVVFCSLFGRMIDLPKGFPMYCKDLKQMLDDKANALTSFELSKLAHSDIVKHNVYETLDSGVLKCTKTDLLKNALKYPKQKNEHNALDDAKWNFELYKFLKEL